MKQVVHFDSEKQRKTKVQESFSESEECTKRVYEPPGLSRRCVPHRRDKPGGSSNEWLVDDVARERKQLVALVRLPACRQQHVRCERPVLIARVAHRERLSCEVHPPLRRQPGVVHTLDDFADPVPAARLTSDDNRLTSQSGEEGPSSSTGAPRSSSVEFLSLRLSKSTLDAPPPRPAQTAPVYLGLWPNAPRSESSAASRRC